MDNTSAMDHGPNRKLLLRRIGLRVLNGPDQGAESTFSRDVIRIGAGEGNHFTLTDDTVSRRHAEIVRTADGVLLRDLGSTNGTFVGEVRLREVYLGEQRTFRCGTTELVFTTLDELIDIPAAVDTHFENIVGQSVEMRQVFAMLDRVAPTELTVLVTGETGTGKELVSRALHKRSARADGPFVVFDCGAVAPNLVGSELFGHEKGAFTGAAASRAGVFEQADGGTLFLDELGELPLELQPTLLRVLEQREVKRLGDHKLRPVDVRIVAATNRDLRELVDAGHFRADLFYRLVVLEVALPSLRDRPQDLPLLIQHILEHTPFEHTVRGIAPDVLSLFEQHLWPGNVRELRNTVLRALPFCDGDLIDLPSLTTVLTTVREGERETGSSDAPVSRLTFQEARGQLIEDFERRYLRDLLERCDGNVSRAARDAGLDRKSMTRKLKQLGLRPNS